MSSPSKKPRTASADGASAAPTTATAAPPTRRKYTPEEYLAMADVPPEERDGVDARELFSTTSRGYGLTYDDAILLPNHISFGVADVSLTSKLTKGGITLRTPTVSSPMDTVTEHRMAIAMALEGGMGFIHGACSVEFQCAEVRKVKRFESGFIRDPVCLKPTNLVGDVDRLKAETGFTGIPITEGGAAGSKLLGLVTSRDIDFMEDRSRRLADVMTKRERLVTLRDGCSLEAANAELRKSKKGGCPSWTRATTWSRSCRARTCARTRTGRTRPRTTPRSSCWWAPPSPSRTTTTPT